MRFVFFFLAASAVSSAASLSITLPPYLSDCPNGYATATLNWSGATAPVQVRIGSATGPAMTGFTNGTGTAQTGDWVTNGMSFFLVDQTGAVQASSSANFACGGMPRTLDVGLNGGSYFPLAIGNTWAYRSNNRYVTGSYVVLSITGSQIIGGQTYYVLSLVFPGTVPGGSANPPLLRAGANGVIYQYAAAGDQVYFDPGTTTPSVYSGPLGTFPSAVTRSRPGEIIATSTYVRGLGMVASQDVDDTGSNGGFLDGADLIEATVDGVHLALPTPKISLSIENTDLDLTDQLVPNCAVPCYYPACGIGSPYDLPGVYRPCARVRLDTSASTAGGYLARLQLLNPAGTTVFESDVTVNNTSQLAYVSLPLYTTPLKLLTAGDYTLTLSIVTAPVTVAQSSITLHVH